MKRYINNGGKSMNFVRIKPIPEYITYSISSWEDYMCEITYNIEIYLSCPLQFRSLPPYTNQNGEYIDFGHFRSILDNISSCFDGSYNLICRQFIDSYNYRLSFGNQSNISEFNFHIHPKLAATDTSRWKETKFIYNSTEYNYYLDLVNRLTQDIESNKL